MNNQTVISAEVARVIVTVLDALGIAPCEREQAVAEVRTRILESIEGRRAPKILRDWQILAAKTAAAWAVAERGCPAVAGVEAAICEDTEEDDEDREVSFLFFGDPRSPGETRQQIAVLVRMLDEGEMPDKAREILARLGDGATPTETARALGLTEADVRARLRETRTRFFRRLAAIERAMATLLGEVDGLALGEDEAELEEQAEEER